MRVMLERGGWYRCIGCGGIMICLLKIDDEGRFIYDITPLACFRCGDFKEAAKRLEEEGYPELVDQLRELFDP